ncbi:MAG: D-alanyl-D-alanine carboxypeptidase/D-alanyl-D-alanine-endopeptidase [Balneolaceae bacterium]|nr:MAG: D-alanyl-D-alanine carboxypeptidase/D-alanyl-D-alanine-endopeptidase [Balneolaceae bacterium]
MKYLFLPLFLLIFFNVGERETGYAQVSDTINQIISGSSATGALWVVQVRDQEGNLIENLNGEKLIRPASNLKLITSGALLDRLDPYFTFETRLYGRGSADQHRWNGDLIIHASGDPSIDGFFYEGNSLFLFEKWADMLLESGIREISGDLIGYDGLFDAIPYPRGWEWDDLSYYYAPEISALSFNSNVVNLEVVADGPVGSPPRIQWSPFNTPYVDFINEQVITPRGTRFSESYSRVLGTNVIFLRSTLPQGYYESEPLTVSNPSYYFLDTMFRYLELRGIRVHGQIYTNSDYTSLRRATDWQLLDTHISEPLHKLLTRLNMESDNFYSEMLVKKLGNRVFGSQGTTDLGLKVIREYMHEQKFDTLQVFLRDGSGMAAANLIPAGDLNRYLFNVQEEDYFKYLYNSLAVAGVNGTLSHRFSASRVQGNFFGKTGFISGVRALSGYLTADSGQQLTITIATNNYTSRTAHIDYIHQKILEFLYENY